MTDTRVALGSDRLPWLDDEPISRRISGRKELWIVGVSVVLLVAAAFYWLGVQSRNLEIPAPAPRKPAVTARLPEPQTLPPLEEIQLGPAPQFQPGPAPEVRQPPIPRVRTVPEPRSVAPKAETVVESVASPEESEKAAPSAEEKWEDVAPAPSAVAATPPLASAQSLRLWPSRVTSGAYGRVVQIGAFGSRQQAKVGWAHMAGAYPGVKRLPAVVVEARNSKGRPFYRFQIGTTSQAHSEVLCQRMEKIRFSCAVVGLPWKPKGVER